MEDSAQRAVEVDGARQHPTARRHLLRHGFARERRGVHLGAAFQHLTVQGDFFTGTHQNVAAGPQHVRGYVAGGSAVQQFVGHTGTRRQQRPYRTAGPPGGAFLHKFAHPVEEHDAHGFGQLPQGYGGHGRPAHQSKFVEEIFLQNALQAAFQNCKTAEGIGQHVAQGKHQPARQDTFQLRVGQHANGEQYSNSSRFSWSASSGPLWL